MAIRPRKYYPNSFIETGIYTKGKEWMSLKGVGYIGPYHKYIDGFTMTLPNYDKVKSEQIIPYNEQIVKGNTGLLLYDSLTELKIKNLNAPKSYFAKPTEQDFKQGHMTRYATQKRNEPTVFQEITQDQFKTITNPAKGINGGLYKGITFKWKLTGPKNDILDENGKITTYGVEDTNRRILIDLDDDYPTIGSFFNDLLEFSEWDDIK